ncbi:predicted protein [Naegleria gruberi]|uniref:Predicted protein n=1 Tax=Naegleria gruberi TaxID=5762 RepID=D2VG00_NAEGR|nr:uncharacterized protein NAEGRDRAFT_67804 [Naegleria gruberi]EFC44172.1 predicted protein [Naegleria gruberi]|eukprot:XP_002676916.1 predicted protein [Naegleria gruberi strain NEG-M]
MSQQASSSSSSDETFQLPAHLTNSYFSTNPHIKTIPGLYVFANYITNEEARQIINTLDSQEWCHEICRRQQHYGYLYYHTRQNIPNLQPTEQEVSPLKSLEFDKFWTELFWEKMVKRDGLFNIDVAHKWWVNKENKSEPQCLVNEYMSSQGIASHVDNVNAFGDVIVGISLLKPVYMTFRKDKLETRILLPPNSCYVLTGESRFEWRHGITHMKQIHVPSQYIVPELNENEKDFTVPRDEDDEDNDGSKLYIREEGYRRISLTFRFIKLEGTKRVDETAPETDALW